MESHEFYTYLIKRGYEERDSQRKMISLCEEVIRDGGVKLIEAPTGTGKTFAYLIPLIATGSKAIISTGTKILQDQLKKDIEFITAHWRVLTGEEVSYAVVKGKANYLCIDRLKRERLSSVELGNIPELVEREWDGDLNLTSVSPEVAGKINVDEDHCTSAYRDICPYRDQCYYWSRLKEKERSSRLLVINHALLALKEFEEPQERILVIDEAHELDRYLTLATTAGISLYWCREVQNALEKHLEREIGIDPEKVFRETFEFLFDEEKDEVPIEEAGNFGEVLKEMIYKPFKSAFKDLGDAVGELLRSFVEERLMISHKLKHYMEKTHLVEEDILGRFRAGYDEPDEEEKNILEKLKALEFIDRKMQKFSAFLRVCSENPHEVGFKVSRTWSKKLQGYNYRLEFFPVFPKNVICADNYRGVILTSATVDPKDIAFTTGIEGDFYRLSWNFDYGAVRFVIKPTNPKREDWEKVFKDSYREITSAYRRVLVLLTNKDHLKILEGAKGVAKQGDDSLIKLIDDLRKGRIKVLVGLDSLWTGIDVPGEKGILMSKLPFDSPDDPLTFHRIRFLKQAGEDPFEYQKRKAFLKFRQGIGRMMRSKEDSGTIILCDNRVWKFKEFADFLKELGVRISYQKASTFQRTWERPY